MKIAFTSCCRTSKDAIQIGWKEIECAQPDYLFLLGDNTYTDWVLFTTKRVKQMSAAQFENHLIDRYNTQFSIKNYRSLINLYQSKSKLHTIWDDHDFLWNNATGISSTDFGIYRSIDKEKKAIISRKLFNQKFNPDKDENQDIYHSFDTDKVRFIFIDNRSYADIPDETTSMIGNKQWQYIEKTALSNPKPLTFICGGLTLTEGNPFFNKAFSEDWTKYPQDLKRLCKLTENLPKAYFLAGDIHSNREIRAHRDKKGNNIPTQFISSGMILGKKHHNWAMLHINEETLAVSCKFYGKKVLKK